MTWRTEWEGLCDPPTHGRRRSGGTTLGSYALNSIPGPTTRAVSPAKLSLKNKVTSTSILGRLSAWYTGALGQCIGRSLALNAFWFRQRI